MKKPLILSILLLSFAATGCSYKVPMNPEEFRTAIAGTRFGVIEDFNVDKSFSYVKNQYQKYSKKCLDKTIKVVSTSHGPYGPVTSVSYYTYNPKVKVNKNSLTFTIQMDDNRGGGPFVDPPEGGMYHGVVDAKRVSKNKTNVKIFKGKWGKKVMWKAIRGWADGSIKGCPDLTRG